MLNRDSVEVEPTLVRQPWIQIHVEGRRALRRAVIGHRFSGSRGTRQGRQEPRSALLAPGAFSCSRGSEGIAVDRGKARGRSCCGHQPPRRDPRIAREAKDRGSGLSAGHSSLGFSTSAGWNVAGKRLYALVDPLVNRPEVRRSHAGTIKGFIWSHHVAQHSRPELSIPMPAAATQRFPPSQMRSRIKQDVRAATCRSPVATVVDIGPEVGDTEQNMERCRQPRDMTDFLQL